jgi:transposase
MINLGPATRIFLAAGSTDMRKGFNGLSALVKDRLECNPLDGHLYLFCNKRRNRLKVLYWDGSGLWICNKRLERGRFSWPMAEESAAKISLNTEELSLLLGGIELERTRRKDWWRRVVQ